MRTMHLFAGIGGGLLADLILGHTPVVAVEWEPYACKVLRERAEEGWFPGLHVWEGDVRLFDPSEYTGIVDCIHAGFPCQDISVAGKQAGLGEGTRSGLYREVIRIAGIVRPRYLFLENVPAILGGGLESVISDLASMGFDAKWCCIRASDVGAPHYRDRWFLLANSQRSSTIEQSEPAMQRGRTDEAKQAGVGCVYVDNSAGIRYGSQKEEVCTGRDSFEYASWWSSEPEIQRVAYGVPDCVGQLKGYGNAQVPLQAATAYRLLGGV